MIKKYWMEERINNYVEQQIHRHQDFLDRKASFDVLLKKLEKEYDVDREIIIQLCDYAGGMWIWAAEVAYVVGYNDGINEYEPESEEYQFA
jgi:hypothetical protein